MINTKTLLIVGAGGSVPYGYPTGFQLTEKLSNPDNFHSRVKEYFMAIKNNGAGDKLISEFCRQFRLSQMLSIDAFLAKRGDDSISGSQITYGELGKLAIASQLMDCEILDRLFSPAEDHWFQYLWNLMNDISKADFHNNQLKIVTFNYDRAIEQYLQTVIQHSYGVDLNEAIELRKAIDIVHVYGDLQNLEIRAYEEISTKFDPLGYGKLADIAKCIKVIPESRDESEEFEKAKEMINWADKICFIGFSFDPINVKRLGFPSHDLSKKKIFFTKYRMEFPEMLDICSRLNIEDADMLSELQSVSCKTLEYLRSAGVLFN